MNSCLYFWMTCLLMPHVFRKEANKEAKKLRAEKRAAKEAAVKED